MSHRRSKTIHRIPIALLIAIPFSVVASDLDDWTAAAATGWTGLHRAADAAREERPIVAIQCAEDLGDWSRDACEVVRDALADRMSDRGIAVVEPWRGFAGVDTWDHFACHAEGTTDHLGWSRIVLHVEPAGRWSARAVARDGDRRTRLHEGELDRSILGARRPDVEAVPPFRISRQVRRTTEAASWLARRMICPLKVSPDKHLLGDVRIVGDVMSPAQADWARELGDAVAAHLNRVLASGYVRDGAATLEMELTFTARDAFRVSPRVVIPGDDEASRRVLVDTDPSRAASVRVAGTLHASIGDLRAFGHRLDRAQAYLERHGLTLAVERVPDEAPLGRIIGQDPAPDTRRRVVAYDVVTAVVSAGRVRTARVPDPAPPEPPDRRAPRREASRAGADVHEVEDAWSRPVTEAQDEDETESSRRTGTAQSRRTAAAARDVDRTPELNRPSGRDEPGPDTPAEDDSRPEDARLGRVGTDVAERYRATGRNRRSAGGDGDRVGRREDIFLKLTRIGRVLQVPEGTIGDCLRAVAATPELRAELERLLVRHDPRDVEHRRLETIWRRWYELAHPDRAPYFPDSFANPYFVSVSDALLRELEEGGSGPD